MVLKKSYLLIGLFFFAIACTTQVSEKTPCEIERTKFITHTNQSNIDLEILLGLTLQPRGIENGKRKLRGISASKRDGDNVLIPLVDENLSEEYRDSWYPRVVKFAEFYDVDEEEALNFARSHTAKIKDAYEKLNVIEVKSQSKLGEFIEFVLSDGCSIWYKQENAYLNENYTESFHNAEIIKEGWYVLRKGINRKVVTEHPDSIKIE